MWNLNLSVYTKHSKDSLLVILASYLLTSKSALH